MPPGQPLNSPGRYSARNMSKPISFYCIAPNAQSVSVVGTFNEWNPAANVMTRQVDGAWFAQVNVNHGHHNYAFLVDGKMVLDPRATGIARDEHGARVSLMSGS
jgi:1,4-alpha-glucan branching enzyme